MSCLKAPPSWPSPFKTVKHMFILPIKNIVVGNTHVRDRTELALGLFTLTLRIKILRAAYENLKKKIFSLEYYRKIASTNARY